ncbi:MAG: glycine cleavage T C-terminal barrel domain-containing protein [Pseudomonadota bacterium]
MAQIIPAGRIRKSPFYASTLKDGAESLLAYNRMLIPRGYGDREAEYWRLINGVSMWDVAAQRQVQIKGPDAQALAQILCTRDLSKQQVGQGKYVAICDHAGRLLNDPIAQKIADDCYWLSIGDSDIWYWSRAIAGERGLNVDISEPDASPLAIQGPKAEEVVASLFGDWVRDLRYFWFKPATLEGIPLMVARSGWSKQGGFELYLLDHSKGDQLWSRVKEAGQPWDIGPGYPNPSERTESGLINWDVDADDDTNPFELRMGKFVDLEISDDVIGIKALRQIAADGPKRHQLGIILEGGEENEDQSISLPVAFKGKPIGRMTHKAWSYRLQRMIGYALVSTDAQAGDSVQVMKEDGAVQGELVSIPFNV